MGASNRFRIVVSLGQGSVPVDGSGSSIRRSRNNFPDALRGIVISLSQERFPVNGSGSSIRLGSNNFPDALRGTVFMAGLELDLSELNSDQKKIRRGKEEQWYSPDRSHLHLGRRFGFHPLQL